MIARVTGGTYDGGTAVTVECTHANSMGVLETEECGAEIECEVNGKVWTIPDQCVCCGNLLGGDPNVRARIEAEGEDAIRNYEPSERQLEDMMNAPSAAERHEWAARDRWRIK